MRVRLDITDLAGARIDARDHGVELRVITKCGPGGGHPMIDLVGTRKRIDLLLNHWGFDRDEVQLMDDATVSAYISITTDHLTKLATLELIELGTHKVLFDQSWKCDPTCTRPGNAFDTTASRRAKNKAVNFCINNGINCVNPPATQS